MAKKAKTPAREHEISDYNIDRADFQIEFYTDHGLSTKKIDKLTTKKAKWVGKKSKIK